MRKSSHKSRRKTCANDNKSKVSDTLADTLRSNCIKTNERNEKKNDCHLDFDDRLINEQKEIEKELIRRLENERRIERQNERIARKEEYMRLKNLGLHVEEGLKEMIKKDHEFDKYDSIDNRDNTISVHVIHKSPISVSKEHDKKEKNYLSLKDTGIQSDDHAASSVKGDY